MEAQTLHQDAEIVPKPSVFGYTDYRKFVADFYSFKKQSNPNYSYATFARKGAILSRSYINLVISGKRRLTLSSVHKFSRALELNFEEGQFFSILVSFNQADSEPEREECYRMIENFKARQKIFPLEQLQSRFYLNWYTPIIFLMIQNLNDAATPSWIQAQLKSKVTLPEIKSSLQLMQDLHLIKWEKDRWQCREGLFKSSDEVRSIPLRAFHGAMIDQGREALNDAVEEREISGLSLCLDEAQFETLKAEIKVLRKKILSEYSSHSPKAEKVICQLNFQLFSLTKKISNEKLRSPRALVEKEGKQSL